MVHLEDLISSSGRAALIARFWSHVDKSGDCWLWTAALTDNGYGQIRGPHYRVRRTVRKHMGVHRFSWELHNGPIPDGLFVCHRCDVCYPPDDRTYRRCVNPAHLFLGTNSENMLDCVAKGRNKPHHANHQRGSRHYNAGLTEDQVRAIRRRWAEGGVTTRQLADEYGGTRNAVYFVVHRRSWRWLE